MNDKTENAMAVEGEKILLLKNQTAVELHAALAPLGVSLRLARRLQAVVLRSGEWPTALPEVSPNLLAKLRRIVQIPHLEMLERRVSPLDGFAKFLFRGDGPEPFETVGIPLAHRAGQEKTIVCVSSQVGCAMGCAFCATGRMGFVRNLETWEMVEQVRRVAEQSPHPVRGVVFMGMGEPLLNLTATVRAAQILSEPCGLAISAKAISFSTVGILEGIRRFTAEHLTYKLIVSLTTTDPIRRREWLPGAPALPELKAALLEYHLATGRRVTLAWTMVAGVNTREADAIQLAQWVGDLPITLDLLDVNDATGQFVPPSPEELGAFRDALRKHLRQPVARRYSGGNDIHAACGMLAGASRNSR